MCQVKRKFEINCFISIKPCFCVHQALKERTSQLKQIGFIRYVLKDMETFTKRTRLHFSLHTLQPFHKYSLLSITTHPNKIKMWINTLLFQTFSSVRAWRGWKLIIFSLFLMLSKITVFERGLYVSRFSFSIYILILIRKRSMLKR